MKKIATAFLVFGILFSAQVFAEENSTNKNEVVSDVSAKSDVVSVNPNTSVQSSKVEDPFAAFPDNNSKESGFSEASKADFGEITEDLKIAGKLDLQLRYTPGDEKINKAIVEFDPIFDLKLEYKKLNSETKVNIKFDGKDNKAEITEGSFKLFYSKFDIEVGKSKVVWGKGDKIHVIDTINANNYYDLTNPEYIDRRLAENMLKLNFYDNNSNLEIIYTPQFTPDYIPVDGLWANPNFRDLNAAFKKINRDLQKELNKNNTAEDGQAGVRYRNTIGGFDFGVSYYAGYMKKPSMNKKATAKLAATSAKAATLQDDQVAIFQKNAEITATVEGVKQQVAAGVKAALTAKGLVEGTTDYQNAYNVTYASKYDETYKAVVQPLQNQLLTMSTSVKTVVEELAKNPDKYYNPLQKGWEDKFVEELNIHYDPVHVFGAEVAAIILGINWRAEAAYSMTKDMEGKDPSVYNNKIGYVIGGDKNIPINNLNINIQLQGEQSLNTDGIKDNGAIDADYDKDEKYKNNIIIAKLSDKYYNNKINPEVTIVYNIDRKDYTIEPVLELVLQDDTKLRVKYKMFEGDEGTSFGTYNKNDYFECGFKYEF